MRELVRMALATLRSYRLRSALSVVGIGIGIASVILLTSIGEGTRRHILGLFTQFGTNLLSINPGKTKTVGIPGILGGTTHKLTIADAEAIRRVPGVLRVVPDCFGTARVEANGRGRSVFVYGVTPDVPEVWQFHVRQGSFWPPGDPERGDAVAVVGPTLARELFPDASPLGRFVRIGGSRFRVIGLMEPKGQMLGIDIDDSAYIPVASAMRLFDAEEVQEINVTYASPAIADRVVADITALLRERHDGADDVTITTQAAMLEVFGNVMDVITLAVGAIAGISVLVGAIGILTMMWIAVGERTGEIGLLRAIGATRRQVQLVFLVEAAVLGGLGGVVGLAGGGLLHLALQVLVPGLPVHTPPELVVAALAVSVGAGLVSGVLPARRAARLDPIEALRAE